jgi:phage baseplate assembly protein V
VIIATEHSQYRLKALGTGEVAIYTHEGAKIVLRNGRVIDVECDVYNVKCKTFTVSATDSSSFETPTLSTSQTLLTKGQMIGQGGLAVSGGSGAQVTGGLKTTEDVVAGGISLQNHTHRGDSGGTTGKPQ